MPGKERDYAKVMNFSDAGSRPFARLLDATKLREATDRLRDISFRIQRRESNADGCRYEATILKSRDVPAPLVKTQADGSRSSYCPGGKAIKFAESTIIRLHPHPFIVCLRPTAWEHLLRDDGLG